MALGSPTTASLVAFLVVLAFPSNSSASEITVNVREAYGGTDCGSAPKAQLPGDIFLALAKKLDVGDLVRCPVAVGFSGEITRESIRPLREVLSTIRKAAEPSPLVTLNIASPGGDVAAALSFATFLREGKFHDLYVNVTRKGCSSACVFILAGAFHRSVKGPVGVHRPYLSDETVREMGYEDLQQTYDALLPTVRAFFRTVNVRESLADEMWQIPSHRMKFLSATELASFGLSADDLVLTELRNAETRAACGADGPALEEDFLTLWGDCLDTTSGLQSDCATRLAEHPYCPCFAKKHPGLAITCSAGTAR